MHAPITLDNEDTSAAARSAEISQRLAAGDGPRIVRQVRQTLDRLIASRAQTSPDATAVVDNGIETSYRSLVERARELGTVLRERHVPRGARFGVCAEASVDLFAAILAIWSLGATYVALDPSLPKARIEQIALDADVALVFVTSATAGQVDPSRAVLLEQSEPATHPQFTSDARLSDVAYIVYTSGSTGAPKGVAVRHDGLANAILATTEVCSLSARDRQLCRASNAFDVAFLEVFAPLAVGATLVIAPRSTWADPRAFIALMVANSITSLVLVTSFLALLLDERTFSDCTSLRVVCCGGEALSIGLCKRFFAASDATLYNGYGPTEATILVTLHCCRPIDAASGEETAPLGRALANTHVSIRTADLVPVAPGTVGEIVIGGVQLADGYINKPDETSARFVADPLRPNERLYRTGDLARLGYDGAVIFLGRNDKQVKIRGQRVEPAEIASAIERLDGVRKAAVLARRRNAASSDQTLILVAYVTEQTGAALDPATLRRTLRDQLPPAMVPAEIVMIDEFPLTMTGKIDEAALTQRNDLSARQIVRTPVRPEGSPVRDILHEQLRTIWEELLGVHGIGDDDDFYELGGDSMLAVSLMMRLEETFGHHPAFADFFDAMTIAGLAELLSSGAEMGEREAVTFNESGSLPPLVFLHGDFGGGMYAWTLARMLGPDQPLLVIPPHGMPGRPRATDVESMAADVVAMLTKFYPSGPIRLGGYSAAGLVAYEAARRLQRAGREVLDVVVIGMGAENVAFTGFAGLVRQLQLPGNVGDAILRNAIRLRFGLERFVRANAREQRTALRKARRGVGARYQGPTVRETIENGGDFLRYVRAHRFDIPRPYDGRVLLLWPKEQPVEHGDILRDWSRIAPRVEIAHVSGTHHAAVSRHLGEIAGAMRRQFARENGTLHYIFAKATPRRQPRTLPHPPADGCFPAAAP